MENHYELVEWADVKADCQYDKDDDNDGYIYGLHYLDGEEILDVEWFTSEGKRILRISELLEMGYTRRK